MNALKGKHISRFLLLTVAAGVWSPAASQDSSGAKPPQEPTAEQAYKNIKVLNGMPASQMLPVMHLMRAALGARCELCHVTEGNRYDLDTKREKETAREMIRMVLAINKDNFKGRTVVTCNTCHRGAEHPVHVPPIGQALFDDTTQGGEEPARAALPSLPSAPEVLDRYIQALGGRAALEKVQSRVSRGTLLYMQVVDSGTPKARAVNRGQESPIEIVQAPGRVTVTVGPPSQQIVQSLEGASGTIKSPDGERPLRPQEVARLAVLADLQKELKLRDQAEKARVRKETLDGKDVLLLRLTGDDGTSRSLYFDAKTGLLSRQIIYRPTLIGLDPEQTDYEDYRDVHGVKVPFLVKTSYVDDNHLGTTRKLTEVRDNEAAGKSP
ncbi:MAG TPA: c-type cytochrome [Thermoanaerobaculia bacterium]|nr:c-type cytochrome [Thermoanaerobaculia bacterium]